MKLGTPLMIGLVATIGLIAQNGSQEQGETPLFRSDTRLVVLYASVVDRKGNFLNTLDQSAFRVYENGVEQPVKLFRREDVPISLGLVVDNSGSMRSKRARVEAAALRLVRTSQRNDEVFIVNFNDESTLEQGFTSDLKLLEKKLTRIDSKGGTAMRDALAASLDYMARHAKMQKKVVFLITDGEDNHSTITLEHCMRAAQRGEVLIYPMGLLSEEEKRAAKRAKRSLEALAQSTGGLAFFPEDVEMVEQIADRVARDIRNQYVLAYTPTNQALDGSYRQIRVVAKGPGAPNVRTRSGYYATPEGVAQPRAD